MKNSLSFPARFALVIVIVSLIALVFSLAAKPARAQGDPGQQVGQPPAPKTYQVFVPMVSRPLTWEEAKKCEVLVKAAPPIYDWPQQEQPANAIESKCWPLYRLAIAFLGFAEDGQKFDFTFSTTQNGKVRAMYMKVSADERIGYTFTKNVRDEIPAGAYFTQYKGEYDVVMDAKSAGARAARALGAITDPIYTSGPAGVIWEKWQDWFNCTIFEDGSQSCAPLRSTLTTSIASANAHPPVADDEVIENPEQ